MAGPLNLASRYCSNEPQPPNASAAEAIVSQPASTLEICQAFPLPHGAVPLTK